MTLFTTLATIPPPPFHNLHVGPLTLHLYGLVIGLAIVVSITVGERVLGWLGGPTDRFMAVTIPAVIGGFVGARLYHVLSEPVRYAHHPVQALEVWHGGLGIYGAVIGGFVTAVVTCRRAGVPFRRYMDAAGVAMPLSQGIGRWGNYLNQELFGRPTSLPWGLRVEGPFRPARYLDSCCFHPTFLYESLLDLTLFGVLITWVWRTRAGGRRAGGTAFPAYLAGYSLLRFFIEGMRSDSAHHLLGLRQNQLVALVLLVIAVVWWAMWQRSGTRPARDAAS